MLDATWTVVLVHNPAKWYWGWKPLVSNRTSTWPKTTQWFWLFLYVEIERRPCA